MNDTATMTPSSPTKRIFSHFLIYASGMIAQKMIGFIMIPIYTRYLMPEDYGVLELLTTTFEIVGIFTGMGLTAAMMRYYYSYKDTENRRTVISTAMIMALCVYPVSASVIFIFSDRLAAMIFGKNGYGHLLDLMIISFIFTSLMEFPLTFIRIREKSIKFITLSLSRLLIALSLNIYFVVILKTAVKGILYSGIITSGLLSSYLLFSTLKETGIRFSIAKAKDMVRYGVPMAFSFLGSFIMIFSDRYFLRVYSSLSDVGVYSLAYKFAAVIPFLIVTPFMQIWGPKRFELADERSNGGLLKKFSTYLAFALITAALGLSLFIKPIIQFITAPAYFGAHGIVPILALSYVFYGFFHIVNTGILVSKKTSYLSYAYLISSIVCLAGNYIFIPQFGAFGAAWTTVLSYLVLVSTTYYFSQSLFKIQFDLYQIAKLVAYGILSYTVLCLYDPDNVIVAISYRFAILVSYLICVFLSGYFSQEEKQALLKIISKPFGTLRYFGWTNIAKK